MMAPRCSDAALTDALRASQGNVNAAARALGYTDGRNVGKRLARNPSLWPEGVPRLAPGGMPRAMRGKAPVWVPCACGEFVCNRHGGHVSECPCPPIEEWTVDPYAGVNVL